MNGSSSFEERLQAAAQGFAFPTTPPISRMVRSRLGARQPRLILTGRAVVFALVILAAAALAVPQVRAQVIQFLRIGVVSIFRTAPTPTPLPPPTAMPPQSFLPTTATPYASRTPLPEPARLISVDRLAGETTLDAARSRLDFPILLPILPADLGPPDHVFIQDRGHMLILVWMDQKDPEKVRLSLHEIGPGSVLINKYEPRVLEQTSVNGAPAAWVEGPYVLEMTGGDLDMRRLVEGSTLIWEADGITYRIESDLTLEEAMRIAESLR